MVTKWSKSTGGEKIRWVLVKYSGVLRHLDTLPSPPLSLLGSCLFSKQAAKLFPLIVNPYGKRKLANSNDGCAVNSVRRDDDERLSNQFFHQSVLCPNQTNQRDILCAKKRKNSREKSFAKRKNSHLFLLRNCLLVYYKSRISIDQCFVCILEYLCFRLYIFRVEKIL